MMESFLSFSRVINGFTEFKQKLDLKARPQVNIGRSLFTNARRTNYDNEKHKNLDWWYRKAQDKAASREPGQPLCMAQYYRWTLFMWNIQTNFQMFDSLKKTQNIFSNVWFFEEGSKHIFKCLILWRISTPIFKCLILWRISNPIFKCFILWRI